MTDDNRNTRSGRIDRRKFLAGLGTGVAAGLAGCSGGGGGGNGGGGNSGGGGNNNSGGGGGNQNQQTSQSTSEQQGQPTKGGKPILGMATAPNSLNRLSSSTAYSSTILDNIYTFGTYADPKSGKPIPGGFESWELTTENIGTGKPTIVAEMRDDLTWSDGKKVTAQDYKFTVDYIKEQEPAGTISSSQFSAVESVEVDSPTGTTVNFFLSEKDNAWLTNVIGNVFLPEHIWTNVADYKKYSPRNSKEGVVGSHAFQIRDFNWENWYELEPRSQDAIPWNSTFDFLDEGGPFVDAVRMEIFGSENALNQAILNGDIDQTYGTIEVEQAAKATNNNSLEVLQSQDDGWGHLSYNVRRVPFDDRVFRQLLNKLLDKQWVGETLYRGLGVEKGTYATPRAYTEWRPPEPEEVGGAYEGIQIPDLSYPGTVGKFNISQSGIDTARQYLIDNPDTKHDYSLGPAESPQINSPDGQEIYVNGQPMAQAHTDNNGNGGQGPLEISLNPPSQEPKRTELINQLVNVYGQVGIPAVTSVQSFNSQLPKIYSEENFDMFEMGWTGIAWNNDHYTQFYGSEGADLDGSADSQLFNAMGYTDADDPIKAQASMMEPEPRKPLVKKVLAQIYSDAPTNILNHARVLQPVTKKFTGRVPIVGGVTNSYTWLNIRQQG